jgi:rhodanese-related sulfurtransferase
VLGVGPAAHRFEQRPGFGIERISSHIGFTPGDSLRCDQANAQAVARQKECQGMPHNAATTNANIKMMCHGLDCRRAHPARGLTAKIAASHTLTPLFCGDKCRGKEYFLDLLDFFQKYWPIVALSLWFAYKWWNSKRIVAMLPELKKKGALFVDVRSAGEFSHANAPATINIPLQELAKRLGEIPKSAPVVLCCASGTRSGMAKMLLKKNGYREVYNIGTWGKFLA